MLSKAQIKYIQSLRQKKFRAIDGTYIAEGPKIAAEVLSKVPAQVEYLAALPSWITANEGSLDRIGREKVFPVDEVMLERLSALSTPNEVLLVLRDRKDKHWEPASGTWCLALDGIQDPGNLGTIIRIADWFGVTHILCSEECAEWHNPKVIQATMGSFLRVHLLYADLVHELRKMNRPVYAATLGGEPVPRITHAPAGVVLIGNESKGLRPELKALATKEVTIPRIGEAESLNAAVATGILLSHFTSPLK